MDESKNTSKISKFEMFGFLGLLFEIVSWLLPNIEFFAKIVVVFLVVIGAFWVEKILSLKNENIPSYKYKETNPSNEDRTSPSPNYWLQSITIFLSKLGDFTRRSREGNNYRNQGLFSSRLSQLPLAVFLICWGVIRNKYLVSDFYDYRFLILPIALLAIFTTTKNQEFVANNYFRFFFIVSLYPTITFGNDFFMFSPIIAGLIIVQFSVSFKAGRTFKAPIASWLLAIHIFLMCFTYILDFDLVLNYWFIIVTGLSTAIAFYKRI